ncbi:MAG: hypothetical protein COS35_04375 [Zetaproteobacteria bacterium CG02_land_8_20_14_3_00_50_9]|nr:MAG: hypothetical protein AUJ57_08415 [Zetaproteobacteria bacterium CG1_02_53_45]PIQ34978.1 MAG: hypothetical protein COW62_00020 [Zetaproteobacteria bacterium CG17_big_fil_post_rev_8_21_14_2_50_50_13]PIV30872.1 MAG: hypothetical protein COS35_04375 [Zetaproteobacteria bacterium CG02_land_8_20_14_3_00_50_9]PIY54775.1 MAG: hypothetical protein COZ00_12975 [Zetaproteobacteria bacterium CG_4_10_14_0_8_um_filter_49_80]
MYEVPAGNDQFELEVTPPFGNEQITVYASTSPTGDLNLKNAGSVYLVTTAPKDIEIRTRGIAIKKKSTSQASASSPKRLTEFAESKIELQTEP